ncbi:hypothetical protein M231_07212 [Tremella mesenterica]|uniref:Uncharacterized protein n=1 Tax=Tremella mesenterica TaxID=5217 RepID=A0A4Q1BFX6_TREME|nr:hypothetical protein M231_07212 [Tremella mesenterica]
MLRVSSLPAGISTPASPKLNSPLIITSPPTPTTSVIEPQDQRQNHLLDVEDGPTTPPRGPALPSMVVASPLRVSSAPCRLESTPPSPAQKRLLEEKIRRLKNSPGSPSKLSLPPINRADTLQPRPESWEKPWLSFLNGTAISAAEEHPILESVMEVDPTLEEEAEVFVLLASEVDIETPLDNDEGPSLTTPTQELPAWKRRRRRPASVAEQWRKMAITKQARQVAWASRKLSKRGKGTNMPDWFDYASVEEGDLLLRREKRHRGLPRDKEAPMTPRSAHRRVKSLGSEDDFLGSIDMDEALRLCLGMWAQSSVSRNRNSFTTNQSPVTPSDWDDDASIGEGEYLMQLLSAFDSNKSGTSLSKRLRLVSFDEQVEKKVSSSATSSEELSHDTPDLSETADSPQSPHLDTPDMESHPELPDLTFSYTDQFADGWDMDAEGEADDGNWSEATATSHLDKGKGKAPARSRTPSPTPLTGSEALDAIASEIEIAEQNQISLVQEISMLEANLTDLEGSPGGSSTGASQMEDRLDDLHLAYSRITDQILDLRSEETAIQLSLEVEDAQAECLADFVDPAIASTSLTECPMWMDTLAEVEHIERLEEGGSSSIKRSRDTISEEIYGNTKRSNRRPDSPQTRTPSPGAPGGRPLMGLGLTFGGRLSSIEESPSSAEEEVSVDEVKEETGTLTLLSIGTPQISEPTQNQPPLKYFLEALSKRMPFRMDVDYSTVELYRGPHADVDISLNQSKSTKGAAQMVRSKASIDISPPCIISVDRVESGHAPSPPIQITPPSPEDPSSAVMSVAEDPFAFNGIPPLSDDNEYLSPRTARFLKPTKRERKKMLKAGLTLTKPLKTSSCGPGFISPAPRHSIRILEGREPLSIASTAKAQDTTVSRKLTPSPDIELLPLNRQENQMADNNISRPFRRRGAISEPGTSSSELAIPVKEPSSTPMKSSNVKIVHLGDSSMEEAQRRYPSVLRRGREVHIKRRESDPEVPYPTKHCHSEVQIASLGDRDIDVEMGLYNRLEGTYNANFGLHIVSLIPLRGHLTRFGRWLLPKIWKTWYMMVASTRPKRSNNARESSRPSGAERSRPIGV